MLTAQSIRLLVLYSRNWQVEIKKKVSPFFFLGDCETEKVKGPFFSFFFLFLTGKRKDGSVETRRDSRRRFHERVSIRDGPRPRAQLVHSIQRCGKMLK